MCGNQKKMDHGASTISWLVLSYIFMIIILSFCYARDVIEQDTPIRDNGETLVSEGGRFELGFFTPNGSSDRRRYVGIWYTFSPLTVVWVANRDNALVNSTGVLAVQDGNIHVLNGSTGNSLWSTGLETSRSSNRTVKLMDSGNLVLREGTEHGESLWESFKNPTDTFLPYMEMDANLILKSWRKEDDPEIGGFTFKQDDREGENQFITMNKSMPYWKSGGKFSSSDKMPDSIVYMLSNTNKNLPRRSNMDYNGTRLMISFDGYIQYHNWDKSKKAWDLIWSEPRDQCSISNFCGKFGSCNADNSNSLACKCLPGFKPSYPEQWKSGDFSGGCNRAASCSDDDKFLSFKMMNVGNTGSSDSPVNNDTECRKECLGKCTCMAYLFQAAENTRLRRGDSSTSTSSCTIWLQELHDLREGYADVGHSLVVHVRIASSDLGSTVRSCAPCGTTLIPYPLSTGPKCGDPMYSSFKCDNSTGRVTFQAITGDYPVISIDPEMRKFIIEVQNVNNCDSSNSSGKILQLNQSLPFNVNTSCSPEMHNISSQISSRSRSEVEIGWELPLEPTCTSDADCKEWRNSNCSYATTDRKNRCLCNTNFKWDGHILNCSRVQESTIHQPPEESPRKRTSSALIVVSIVASTVAALACFFISFIIWRRKMSKKKRLINPENRRSDQRSKELLRLDTQRRIKHLMNSGEFEEEHEENIDVPFFDFESIIAATDDFSDANKLGKGGYGPVYKGKFPGGQEIAVKRLSSVSGQGLQEFKNEVVLIAKLQHRNLVRLRGYCIKGEEKILLYEYMPNKSLDSFIFDETKSVLLNWEMRFNIILGIARGLLYLHHDSRLRIIHRDLKTSNILLDQDMEPKISDFGLARIVGGKQTEANTNRVVGTYGYMSPEYALEGLFSVKSDVFSFGVVLLEILSGKRNTRLVHESKPPLTLLGYAWRLWTENKVLDLMEPTLHESCKEDQYLKCFKVGLLCVQEDPSERPTMSSVVTMLDSESSTVPTPQQPAFVLRKSSVVVSSSSSKPDTIAEMTATLEEGR